MIFPDVDSHPDADAELEAAVDRYLAYSADSAERFLNAVGKLVVDLCKWPQSGRVWEPWEREPTVYTYGVPGYPFRIVYYIRDGEPVIVAYAHEKRRPGYWEHRV